MKRLIVLLIIIGFASWAGVEIAKDPGYMLLAYHQWTLETPLWLGILLWLLLFLAFSLVTQVWRNVGSTGAKWYAWRARRRLAQTNNLTLRAMLEALEGYFPSAAKNFEKTLPNAELPLLNLLGAAYCAEKQGQSEIRDQFLDEAIAKMPEAQTAIRLTKIHWLSEAEQWGDAVYHMEHLLQDDPYHQQALLLAQTLYQRLGLWQKLLKTSTTLRKRKLIPQPIFENIQIKAYGAMLQETVADLKALNSQWLTIPTHYQHTPSLVLIYAKALIRAEEGSKAAEFILEVLKKHWDDELVMLYGQAVLPDTEQQLKQAEKWLQQHETNAGLLLTLGRLCIRANLWGKARSYLEASCQIQAKPETYLALAELSQGHGEIEKACQFYQKGLLLALNKVNKA